MPPLARAFIKSGMLYLVAGFALGALLLLSGVVALPAVLRASQPVYFHLLMVGWITGLIMGVAFWLFPRPDRNRPPPPESLGWTAYTCLYLGLLLRLPAEPATAMDPLSPLRWLLPLSGLLQLAAAVAFVALIWPRVRTR